jgi:hypothetical protein
MNLQNVQDAPNSCAIARELSIQHHFVDWPQKLK